MAGWLIFGVIFPCMLFLAVFGFIGGVRGMREQPRIAKESGWKRVGWGLYLTGPWGGPYQGAEGENQTPAVSGEEQRRVRRIRLLLALVLATEVLAVIGGVAIADALDRSVLAGALVGLLSFSLLIGAVWLLVGGRALRSEIAQRGHHQTT